jgi:hypothetical protein
MIKKNKKIQAWWCMPVAPPTWEAEGGLWFEASLSKISGSPFEKQIYTCM